MRCPVCNKRMGGNLYGSGLMCPGCGYVEPPEAVLDVSEVEEAVKVEKPKGKKKGGKR